MPNPIYNADLVRERRQKLGLKPDGCLVIGEVAQTHDGSLGLAHAFVDAIANAGADAVKFQTHIASAESTPAEPWRVRFSPQDATRYEYWQRMEFTEEQWAALKTHAEDRGLLFLSSPFSDEAIALLTRIGMRAWKIASGEVANTRMLAALAATGKPILLSSGMSGWREIDEAVSIVEAHQSPVAVLQCTSAYPCPPERVGLNMIEELRARYGCASGLSDHSGTMYPALAAASHGADVVEIHVALTREMFGPDVPASITTSELRQLVDGIRFVDTMLANPIDKDASAADTAPLRDLFTKSIVARVGLPAGTVLRPEHLAAKKPGTGIPAARMTEFVGARLVREIDSDEQLQESHVEARA